MRLPKSRLAVPVNAGLSADRTKQASFLAMKPVDMHCCPLHNSRFNSAPVAQLDRVPGYELGGREFESLQARHFFAACLEMGRLSRF